MAKFDEAHFIPLSSQTNIYGLTRITDTDTARVLVGSSKGKVLCVEYISKWDNPVAREVPFTYIPSEAEIVSIDAFVRTSSSGCGLVVGISLILCKSSHNKQKQFLNIYSSVEQGKENCLDSIAEGCQLIELDFVPFQLYHTELRHDGRVETVFLLSGSDHAIHMYREVVNEAHQTFERHLVEDFFPELQQLPSNVLWMDIKHTEENKRLTAIGCENGYVQLSIVDTLNELNIIGTWSVQHDGPITSVKLFTTAKQQDCATETALQLSSEDCHLLVCCAIEPCSLYLDVMSHGFERPLILPDSDNFDCVLCTCIADVDCDGNNELLLGTYGQELLVYKMTSRQEGSIDVGITWQRRFNSPLFAIDYLDMTRDGLV
ncbi:hypothetical protein QZH41_010009 [Actinostola sp. cb2023]|nr:hypothetical protein QZH41_010009 [Actinostola sp. cb2023]